LFAIQPDGGGREMSHSKMKKLHYIAATLALASAGVLSAQSTDDTSARGPRHGGHRGHGGPGGPSGPGHPIVRALDVNRDGEIAADEITGASVALAKLDTNADGTVAIEELHPGRPAGAPTPPAGKMSRHGDRPRTVDLMMLALDANKDGALSGTEISGATASLKALDANSDGKLTRDELRPLPPTSN
jgi:hypothetical protein